VPQVPLGLDVLRLYEICLFKKIVCLIVILFRIFKGPQVEIYLKGILPHGSGQEKAFIRGFQILCFKGGYGVFDGHVEFVQFRVCRAKVDKDLIRLHRLFVIFFLKIQIRQGKQGRCVLGILGEPLIRLADYRVSVVAFYSLILFLFFLENPKKNKSQNADNQSDDNNWQRCSHVVIMVAYRNVCQGIMLIDKTGA